MKKIQIPLRDDFVGQDREELLYKLNFFQDIEIQEENNLLNITCRDDSVCKDIARFVDEMKVGKKIKTRVLFESSAQQTAYSGDIYKELLDNKNVVSYRAGIASLDQTVSAVMDFFDGQFSDIARSFGAEAHTYPTLMPVEILERCKYFESFPQYLNFVTHIEEDRSRLASFPEAWTKRNGNGFELDEYFKKIDCVLSPAVCYHSYRHYENESMQSGNKVVTAKGKCFRYESNNMKTLERLWDFTMREIVFIGNKQFVLDMRKESIKCLSSLINSLGLKGHIEVANDPFFTSDAAQKKLYQLGFELKYEIRLHIPFENKEIAAGSFNFHEDFFGRAFNINAGEAGRANTGCTAFGLERWAYAFLSQFGPDRKNWPEEVRKYIEFKTAH